MLAILLLLYMARDSTRKKSYILMALLLSVIMSCRSRTVGTDTGLYSIIFEDLSKLSFNNGLSVLYTNRSYTNIYTKAPFWTIIFKFIGWLFDYNYKAYIFFSGIIVSSLISIYLFKFCNHPQLALLLYFLVLFLPSLNTQRTFFAIGLVLASSYYAYRKNYWAMVVFLIPAVLIHRIAVIGIATDAVFLINWDKKKIRAAAIIIIYALIYSNRYVEIFTHIFSGDYGNAIDYANDQVSGKNIAYQIAYISLLILYWNLYNQRKISKNDRLINSLAILTLLELAIGIAGFQKWYLQRINYFFQIYCLILASILFSYKNKYKIIYKLIIYSVFGFGFVYMIYSNKGNIVPYSLWIAE